VSRVDWDKIKSGDRVRIEAKVVETRSEEVGLLVELFSKTDQYEAWVRADHVVEHVVRGAMDVVKELGDYAVVRFRDKTYLFVNDVWLGEDGYADSTTGLFSGADEDEVETIFRGVEK
jgi:hypothetical protein